MIILGEFSDSGSKEILAEEEICGVRYRPLEDGFEFRVVRLFGWEGIRSRRWRLHHESRKLEGQHSVPVLIEKNSIGRLQLD